MDFGVLILESGFWILGIGFCRFDFGFLICVFGFWKFEMLFLFYIYIFCFGSFALSLHETSGFWTFEIWILGVGFL